MELAAEPVEVLVAEVYIDDAKQILGVIPGTWGDLLTMLDDRVSEQRLLVTAIRLDGVDEPAFRHPSVASKPLSAVRRVDVQTIAPEALFKLCCADAEGSVADMASRALELAAQFRQQDVTSGHRGLATWANDLCEFLMLLEGMLHAPGFKPEWLTIGGVGAPEQIAALGSFLETMVAAQTESDWLTVSDILEYDMEPALRRWQHKLHDVAGSAH